jgi:hypothetical protein
VGVVVAAGACLVVKADGPEAGVARVGGEVGDGAAELLVAGPAEAGGVHFAELAGGRHSAGEAGQRSGGRERGAAASDLSEQPGGPDGAGAGQRGEDVRVGMQGQLLGDLLGQCLDLLDQGGQDGEQGPGDAGLRGAVVTGRAAGCGGQAGVQDGGVGAAAVADAGQPGSQAPGRESVRAVLGLEAGQEADRAGEGAAQVGAQLVSGRRPGG